MHSGQQINIHKCNAQGDRLLTYAGEVIAADTAAVVVRAVWTRGRQVLPYVTLEQGDVFIETFYRDRWYNVFEVRAASGELKGWYANITRPPRIAAADLDWLDLATDAWMSAEGRVLVLDEEEFEALRSLLPVEVMDAAHAAMPLMLEDLRVRWRAYANDQIAAALLARGWTLATAESCTGGLVGDVITERAGSSAYFVGGVIAYSNAVKQHVLGVRAETLQRFGAVSAQCALEMAQGVRRALGAHVGVSTTGIAGPGGATPNKPVGLTFVALSTPESEHITRNVWQGDRHSNKQEAADEALRLLLRWATERGDSR
ncbi:MAG: nicotinamide-nucleotide amidohydrolase family protein [Thermoflexales bacterium]|nr:nicotinamide-nucleotide amidohydrolase family protein [Thermoflexales bacterium]MCS7325211.1 nicotinamide-nucleotide amidohydrolase family protein [Thermoflexales bacterium]MCX7939989.1 nicotinamide-nucleotide amidohydrolase family protein [Thermoflexales bacterium]MDW8053363.1 nicotinamide-nucleotide amidohydrolase family protein [Anaerolineae bacterium]MDW8292016.1 nicotinamide-nucleotide amidohydrolase family protein [Anaerolineae bacterium]